MNKGLVCRTAAETGEDCSETPAALANRSFRYRLSPTPEQETALAQFAGATRFVYNLALEQRRDFWRQYRAATGRSFNFASQGLEVTQLRAELPWLAAVHSTPLTHALRDLDRAFANFWSGRARYPTPRRKGINDSFRFKAVNIRWRQLNSKWSAVRVPKIGWIKFRDTRPICGELVNATISRRAGIWHISFAVQVEHKVAPSALPAIGIDRGIANTLALSNGELLSTPDTTRLERRKRRAQRALSRRKRGSRRYQRQRSRVAKIAAKLARIRADWQHRASLNIAERFGVVALENLAVRNMTASGKGKRGLNRSILEQGWGGFETKLAYKLEERGGTLVKINPAFTSQECSACGVIDRASRENQASYVCRSCGFAIHADTNAAINILRRGTASMLAEGRGCAPEEARTVNLAA
jgi:putative transposase